VRSRALVDETLPLLAEIEESSIRVPATAAVAAAAAKLNDVAVPTALGNGRRSSAPLSVTFAGAEGARAVGRRTSGVLHVAYSPGWDLQGGRLRMAVPSTRAFVALMLWNHSPIAQAEEGRRLISFNPQLLTIARPACREEQRRRDGARTVPRHSGRRGRAARGATAHAGHHCINRRAREGRAAPASRLGDRRAQSALAEIVRIDPAELRSPPDRGWLRSLGPVTGT
jgi:hypothetical protein